MTSAVRAPATVGTIVAAVFVAAGVITWVTTPNTDASFGWYAYAPLADSPFSIPIILHGQPLVAAGLIVVGMIIGVLTLGFAWGHRAGLRATPRGHDPLAHPASQ